jgi:hypothetical protein
MSHFVREHHTHYDGYPSEHNYLQSRRPSLSVDVNRNDDRFNKNFEGYNRNMRGPHRTRVNTVNELVREKKKLLDENNDLKKHLHGINIEISKYNTLVEENAELKADVKFLREQLRNKSQYGETEHADHALLVKLNKSEEREGKLAGELATGNIKLKSARESIEELKIKNKNLKGTIDEYKHLIEVKTSKISELKRDMFAAQEDALHHKRMCEDYRIKIKELEKSHSNDKVDSAPDKKILEEDVESEEEKAKKLLNEPKQTKKKTEEDTDKEEGEDTDKEEEEDTDEEEEEDKGDIKNNKDDTDDES